MGFYETFTAGQNVANTVGSQNTPAKSYGSNYGLDSFNKASASGGGFGAIGGGIGMAVGGPVGGAIGGAIGGIVDIFAGASKAKAERKAQQEAMGLQIDAQNTDVRNQYNSYMASRDKTVDDPIYKQAMANASSQRLANIGSPVLARPDAYDPYVLQEQIADMNGGG